MKRNRGDPTIRVAELFVRAALPNFSEPKPLKDAYHLARLEHWRFRHRSTDLYRLDAYELALESGISVFQQHCHDFLQILVELVEGRALAMSSRKSGNVTDEKSRICVAFDNGSEMVHRRSPLFNWYVT
jgi:hypothetical protein